VAGLGGGEGGWLQLQEVLTLVMDGGARVCFAQEDCRCPSSRRPGFDSGRVFLEFVADKAALVRVFLRLHRVFLVITFQLLRHVHTSVITNNAIYM